MQDRIPGAVADDGIGGRAVREVGDNQPDARGNRRAMAGPEMPLDSLAAVYGRLRT